MAAPKGSHDARMDCETYPVTDARDIEPTAEVPGAAHALAVLLPNIPNPFNPSTTLHYEVELDSSLVRPAISDVPGWPRQRLLEGLRPPGRCLRASRIALQPRER